MEFAVLVEKRQAGLVYISYIGAYGINGRQCDIGAYGINGRQFVIGAYDINGRQCDIGAYGINNS